MRFHSTPESAFDGEITILAIIETVLSVVAYVLLCLYLGTFKYLAWAVVFAPLMLFRTEESSEWGLNIYTRSLQTDITAKFEIYLKSPLAKIVAFLLFTTIVATTGLIIRIVA